MYKPNKESLAKLRKAAGYGYCPRVIELLQKEYNYPVDNHQDVYDVAHGKKNDDTILQAFLTYVIRKTKETTPTRNLVDEALKAISVPVA